ncbi:SUMO-activating enzyme subunit 2 [Intoshia linei]|uniref:SUMO-activating enzyme subunit 2 n=1 Tax=Intoshia linei TaxID=1819745 RepID=A0A177B5B8_9BILA|nr:SUMO-activating enzyme subunit 2 [Intoshia linei]
MDNSIDFNHINVLMVGAGGIGCELLKCLVLSGFINIEVIDLDIIDVSNLNRQFLFRPHHVGQPKAQIAAESALKFNKNANILPKHISIFDSSFDVEYFKKFKIVISALDNIEARSHVNRLCLASNVYLIDAASQGYIGQTRIIIKGMTQCYECLPLPKKKNYPTCTIRNTPSEHIHCIIWAKHLFNLLFGEIDIDSDVIMSEKSDSDNSQKMTNGNVNKISLRKLAEEVDYDSKQLLYEIFFVNINNLLLMEKLWKERIAPIPLNVDEFSIDDIVPTDSHLMWSLSENVALFHHTIPILKQKMLESNNVLTWDKDDDLAMNFVTCVSNIRAHVFGIKQKTEFEIKYLCNDLSLLHLTLGHSPFLIIRYA